MLMIPVVKASACRRVSRRGYCMFRSGVTTLVEHMLKCNDLVLEKKRSKFLDTNHVGCSDGDAYSCQ